MCLLNAFLQLKMQYVTCCHLDFICSQVVEIIKKKTTTTTTTKTLKSEFSGKNLRIFETSKFCQTGFLLSGTEMTPIDICKVDHPTG